MNTDNHRWPIKFFHQARRHDTDNAGMPTFTGYDDNLMSRFPLIDYVLPGRFVNAPLNGLALQISFLQFFRNGIGCCHIGSGQ